MSFTSVGSSNMSMNPVGLHRRMSSCQSGSPLRIARELKGLRDSTAVHSIDAGFTPFPVLANYEQIVGCIVESVRTGCVTVDDFERGIESVRNYISASGKKSGHSLDCVRPPSDTSGSMSQPSGNTPLRQRGRAFSVSHKPTALALDEEDAPFKCERKWSFDTTSTALPSSCTNERRLRTLSTMPSNSPGVGCSPAPHIPLPPASPSATSFSRPRALSYTLHEPPTPSPNTTPFFTPTVQPATPASATDGLKPLSFSDVSIGDIVGAGSFGVVHRARVKSTGQLIVAKVVSADPRDGLSISHLEALENELALLQCLKHPRIVRFLGFERVANGGGLGGASPWNEENEKLIIFCEYMPGGSLACAIKQFGAFDEKAIALHTKQILEGLAFLHENRICHRDLKCGNILIDVSGCCKLADFGCSKRLDVAVDGATIAMKSVKGSIPWMAPEVLMGQGYGRSSDIWAVGCVVLEMALGHNPWGKFDNILQAMYRIGMGTTGPEIPETLSDACRKFVDRCLAREARARPTAVELLDDPFVQTQ